jgi:hypothetical protein
LFTVLGTFLFCLVTISYRFRSDQVRASFSVPRRTNSFAAFYRGRECFNVAGDDGAHQRDVARRRLNGGSTDVDAKQAPEQTCEVE